MSKLLPDWLIGCFCGFIVGVLAWTGLAGLLPISAEAVRFLSVVCYLIGAIAGGLLGALWARPAQQGGTVARWAVGTAAVVGGIAFLAGFAGPMIVRPDLPQGPLLGIFFTGPLGAIAGLVIGLVIGLVLQQKHI